ncbi:hypothetical protein GCM10022224_076990 [Nonomuraea antimicrobica]|uniref:Transposase n=1 Tax=Nonomuraea antimicrobica TaxID=561173 RepID=A0ABP7D5B4_9ACTN
MEIGAAEIAEAPGGGKWSVRWGRPCHGIRTAMPQEQEDRWCYLEFPQMSLYNPQRRRVVQTMEKEWHGSRKGTVPGTAVALLMEAWWQ